MVFSHGFAVTLVMATMVLRLILGLAMVVVLVLSSLDLLVIHNHNHFIVIWYLKRAVKNLKKNITRYAFSGLELLWS